MPCRCAAADGIKLPRRLDRVGFFTGLNWCQSDATRSIAEHRFNTDCIDHTTAANARDDRESLAHDRFVDLGRSGLGRMGEFGPVNSSHRPVPAVLAQRR